MTSKQRMVGHFLGMGGPAGPVSPGPTADEEELSFDRIEKGRKSGQMAAAASVSSVRGIPIPERAQPSLPLLSPSWDPPPTFDHLPLSSAARSALLLCSGEEDQLLGTESALLDISY